MRGDVDDALASADVVVEGAFETGFVEHAYIEPEAGFARRVGDRMEVTACTQAPYMDRDDVAAILGIAPATCALFRRQSAAVSAPSSIFPSSRLSRSPRGISIAPSR